MRSKSRARKVANDGAPHTTDQLDGQADSADDLSSLDGALGDLSSVCQVEVPLDNTSLASSPDSPDSISAGPGRHMAPLVTASHKVTPPATSHKVAPISASHKIAPLPSYLELRSSGVGGPAPGVWTTEDLTQGQRILALAAVAADDDDDDDDEEEDEEMVSGEKQIPDHYGKRGRGWLENNDPDVRRWTKYVRGAGDGTTYQPNVVTVQLNDQVYYRTLRGISAGDELLTSGGSCGSDGRGPRYPAQQRHQGTTLHNTGGNGNGRNGGCVDRNGGHLDRNGGHVDRNGGHVDDQEQKQLPCIQCGEVFRSKVALRRHQTYVCYNRSAIFGPARRQIYKSASSSGTHTDTDPPPEPASHRHDDDADDRGTLPQRSNAQEMIQDAHRVAASASSHLSSPQPGHDQLTIATAAANAAANAHRYDHLSCRLDDGLGRLKQYGCENCEKVFIDSAELQRHIRSVHVGARSHTCTDCGKTFATSSGLKQHQHIHSSVKPFQCEVCLKAYTQFSNLCRHKRMHADCRQQIKCKDCGQTFSTMTSLGKHKRFCQGMLSNGSTGRSMSGYPASSDKPSAGGVGAIRDTNSAKMSAFSSPYGVPFYGQRPAFPFFPPVGAGFPMFPTAHPMAAMMSANLSESKRHRLSHDDELSRDLKDSKNNDSDLEQEKNNGKSSRWASDHSNISTDFGKSDFDSESDSEHVFQHGLHDNGRPIKTSSPALASPIPIIKKETRPERDMEVKRSPEAFDLSTILSSSTPKNKLLGDNNNKSTSSSSGEQPLDLSYKVTKDDLITPRKTHIFGREERKARALPNNNSHHSHSHSHLSKEKISLLPKSKPQSPATTTNVSLSPKGKLPVEASPERTMHEAYPSSTTSQLMMSRMYGHSLEKHNLEAYQEAARFMSMAPSRFQFPGMPAPFHPFTGALPGMFHHQSHLDQAKSMAAAASSPAFMRGPASFPYAPGMNKLKDRYTCKFCGKIFPRSANLTRHLRTHTGEQPYKCKYCERSFSISSNLQRHIRNIHNKEKPFKCPICDRCFGQQTNLDRHLKKHEFEGPIVADSPIMEEHDLDELTPLTTTELGSTGSSGHASELSSPVKEDKEPPALDKMAARHHGDKDLLDDSLERGSEELEDDWDHTEATDDDDDDDLDDELHYPAKKAKLLNNNLPADSGYGVMNLSGASS